MNDCGVRRSFVRRSSARARAKSYKVRRSKERRKWRSGKERDGERVRTKRKEKERRDAAVGKEDRFPYLGWSGAGEGLSNGEFRHAALSLSHSFIWRKLSSCLLLRQNCVVVC